VVALAVLPLAALNLVVEGSGGDRPVRIGRWLERLEEIAAVALLLTIGLVVVRGRRLGLGRGWRVGAAIAQLVLVFLAGEALLVFSRGGGLHGGEHVASYPAPDSQAAHVYRKGAGCGYEVYLQRSLLALTMHRVRVLTRPTGGEPPPAELRWSPAGVTLWTATGEELLPSPCKGLLD